MIETINTELSELYTNYGKTSDEDIKKHLSQLKITIKQEIGKSGKFAYYEMSDKWITDITKNLRNKSIIWDIKTKSTPLDNVIEYAKISYLVKSTSRFTCKPDIGEVFDKIDFSDEKLCGICIYETHKQLSTDDYSHFIMEVGLLMQK